MQDKELRAVILRKLYDQRQRNVIALTASDVGADVPFSEVRRICRQMQHYGLVKYLADDGRKAQVRLLAPGVDAVESRGSKSPVEIQFAPIQNVNIINSSNVVVGHVNVQEVKLSIEKLVAAINQSSGSEEQKEQARSLLSRFLEHPLVTSIAGGLVGLVT